MGGLVLAGLNMDSLLPHVPLHPCYHQGKGIQLFGVGLKSLTCLQSC